MSQEKFEKSEFTSEEWAQYKSFLKDTRLFKYFKEIGITSLIPNETLGFPKNGRVQGYWEVSITTLSGQEKILDEYYGTTYPGALNLYKSCWIDAAKELFTLPQSPNHRVFDRKDVSDVLTYTLGFFSFQELHQLNSVSKNFKSASETIAPRIVKIDGEALTAAVTGYPGATFDDLWSSESAQAPKIRDLKNLLNQIGDFQVKKSESFIYINVKSQTALNAFINHYRLNAKDIEELNLNDEENDRSPRTLPLN